MVLRTAVFAILAFVQTKENVVLVIGASGRGVIGHRGDFS
jgi:hypothetical protein